MADRVPSYDYWIAKGFLLLAKNYHAMGDDFQAKETFKSIIEKCEIPELVKAAQESLNEIEALEQKNNETQTKEETEIKFDAPAGKENEIFDAPQVPENKSENE